MLKYNTISYLYKIYKKNTSEKSKFEKKRPDKKKINDVIERVRVTYGFQLKHCRLLLYRTCAHVAPRSNPTPGNKLTGFGSARPVNYVA